MSSDFIESVAGMTEVPIPKHALRSPLVKIGVLDNDFIASRNGKTFWRFGSWITSMRGPYQYIKFVSDDRYMQ